jgi:transglutaminase-like putative cysteine protease
MSLQIIHRTEYVYDSAVSSSYGQLYLLPRSTAGQSVLQSQLVIEPTPDSYNEFTDFYGNQVVNFSVATSHSQLIITATSDVDISGAIALTPDQFLRPQWEEAVQRLVDGSTQADLEAREFAFASELIPLTDVVRTYAASSFWPGRGLLEIVSELTGRIYSDLTYKPGVTTLTTLPQDVLSLGEGVCQDFAQLQIACLRSFGLAARYVSGYLETLPPPGQAKLRGADASHAWLSVYVPDVGWVDVDPTNNCFIGERHICTAWGRDYRDVSPVKGIIFTDAKRNTMKVSVDVSHLS